MLRTRPCRAACLLLLLVTGAFSRASACRAQDADQAETYYREAMAAYNAGDYRAAIAGFRSSYALSHEPTLLFNIALSYRKLGDCHAELSAYREYLQVETDATNRAKVEARIVELNGCGDSPARDASSLNIPRGSESVAAAHPPPTAGPDTNGASRHTLPLATAGVGVAVLISGALLVNSAEDDFDRFKRTCAPRCAPSVWEGAEQRESVGNILQLAGGAVIAAGLTWWALRHFRGAPTRVAVSPAFGGLVASGEF
jgi:tetratricopeptide (TPR) repeat protein